MKNIRKYHTDVKYLTKSEFDNEEINHKDVKNWEEVLEYRKKYSFEIPLIQENYKNVFLTQTPWILQKEIKLISKFSELQQNVLVNISWKYNSAILMNDISLKSFVNDIHWLLNEYKFSRKIIENLISNNTLERNEKDEDEEKIIFIYNNLEKIISKLCMPIEIYKIFYSDKTFNQKKFGDIHTSLVMTLKSNKINSILTKCSAILYSILSTKMFGDVSYEIALLSLLSLLRNSYNGELFKGISLFKTLDYFKYRIIQLVDEVKNSDGDLTFLTQEFSNILIYCGDLATDQINDFIKYSERYNILSEKDKNKNYVNILKKYPQLSKMQARFYIDNSKKNYKYTIKDFKEYSKSSYETSRYSLEKLVKVNLYSKEKVGKKYIYIPKEKK
ncbi:MAG: hypothetical protein TYPL_2260 [Candidatus Tyloplasma litorale]|nr:MAG: hypothetical protein TYPL_2260 [Mycoplasmatales bacterium]